MVTFDFIGSTQEYMIIHVMGWKSLHIQFEQTRYSLSSPPYAERLGLYPFACCSVYMSLCVCDRRKLYVIENC